MCSLPLLRMVRRLKSAARSRQFPADAIDAFKAGSGAAKVRHLHPVVPVCGDETTQAPFRNANDMLSYDGERNSSLPQLALEYEAARSGMSHDEVRGACPACAR